MGTGTDVAIEAGDLTLMDSDLRVAANAIASSSAPCHHQDQPVLGLRLQRRRPPPRRFRATSTRSWPEHPWPPVRVRRHEQPAPPPLPAARPEGSPCRSRCLRDFALGAAPQGREGQALNSFYHCSVASSFGRLCVPLREGYGGRRLGSGPPPSPTKLQSDAACNLKMPPLLRKMAFYAGPVLLPRGSHGTEPRGRSPPAGGHLLRARRLVPRLLDAVRRAPWRLAPPLPFIITRVTSRRGSHLWRSRGRREARRTGRRTGPWTAPERSKACSHGVRSLGGVPRGAGVSWPSVRR